MKLITLYALEESIKLDLKSIADCGKNLSNIQDFKSILQKANLFLNSKFTTFEELEQQAESINKEIMMFKIQLLDIADELKTNVLNELIQVLERLRTTVKIYFTTLAKTNFIKV